MLNAMLSYENRYGAREASLVAKHAKSMATNVTMTRRHPLLK